MTDYQKLFSLTGKRAVITGGGGFLGEHFAAGLLAYGATVALVDLDKEHVRKVAAKLSMTNPNICRGYQCNITDPASMNACADAIDSDLGGVDIVINSAQANDIQVPFEESTITDWQVTSTVNGDGTFLSSQAFGNLMIKHGIAGTIIQISSIYGIVAPDHRIYEGVDFNGRPMGSPAVYSYTKAGMIGLSKYLAAYWANDNIRVNTITPGGVEAGQSDQFKARYNGRVPMGRMARPEEIVGSALFLASDASSYITGQNLVVDGGLSVW